MVVAVGLVDRHLSLILMYMLAMKQCIGDVSVRNEEKESASHPRHDKITRILSIRIRLDQAIIDSDKIEKSHKFESN